MHNAMNSKQENESIKVEHLKRKPFFKNERFILKKPLAILGYIVTH